MMQTVPDIIEALGGNAAFARAVGVAPSHAGAMKARRSIPPRYWSRVVEAAETVGRDDITLERLADIAAQRGAA